MTRRVPALIRRGGRFDPLKGGASLLSAPPDAFISITGAGFTEVSGDVASMDGVGSSLSRLEPRVTAAPQTAVGELTGVTLGTSADDVYVSNAAVDATLGVLFSVLIKTTNTVSNDRIFDLEGFIRCRTGVTAGTFSMEHAGADIVGTTVTSVGDIVCLTCYYAPTGGTSRFWVNGILQGTAAGNNSLEPTSRVFSVGGRATDGAVAWAGTFLEAHVWSDVDDLSAFDRAGLDAYTSQQAVRAGGAGFAHVP